MPSAGLEGVTSTARFRHSRDGSGGTGAGGTRAGEILVERILVERWGDSWSFCEELSCTQLRASPGWRTAGTELGDEADDDAKLPLRSSATRTTQAKRSGGGRDETRGVRQAEANTDSISRVWGYREVRTGGRCAPVIAAQSLLDNLLRRRRSACRTAIRRAALERRHDDWMKFDPQPVCTKPFLAFFSTYPAPWFASLPYYYGLACQVACQLLGHPEANMLSCSQLPCPSCALRAT